MLLVACSSLTLYVQSATRNNLIRAQIGWLRSKGGFLSEKVAIRPIDEADENAPNGYFAIKDISEGEKILILPKDCIFLGYDDDNSYEDDNSYCGTARRLVKEYKLGKESNFSSYSQYMFLEEQFGLLPSAWSELGSEVLQTIIGDDRSGYFDEIQDIHFENYCESGENSDYELLEHAYHIVVSRGWGSRLLPFVDMINHRNGYAHNVDQVTSAHDDVDVEIEALRDIAAGEQLHNSYNECHDTDCDDISLTYVLNGIFRDYGFVEQYPRRWNLNFGLEYSPLVVEVDENDEENFELELLVGEEPDLYEINRFRGQLKRLRDLDVFVEQNTSKLTSRHEKETIKDFFEGLKLVLDLSIEAFFDKAVIGALDLNLHEHQSLEEDEQESEIYSYGDYTCEYPGVGEAYDSNLEFGLEIVNSQYLEIRHYEHWEGIHSDGNRDICLALNGLMMSCSSFRPHYHENLVHIPLRYVKNFKRALFLGGGDNMVLHEILKYPSLELVVGLELDQQVVRSTFKHMLIQPHFDDERVQWWFGDASKSLLMLPAEYFGTFDLVIVDLVSVIGNTLMVTKDLSLYSAAELLLAPDGIIVRNEDYLGRKDDDFAKFMVTMGLLDQPVVCGSGITFGSNTIDFVKTTPNNIAVTTNVLDPDAEHFKDWFHYRRNENHVETRCSQWASALEQSLDEENKTSHGVLLVLEAENATIKTASKDSIKHIISKALRDANLQEISFAITNSSKQESTLVIILEEGYSTVRWWPQHMYFAVDLLLWSRIGKQEVAKSKLLAALQSDTNSSFRIVTGGMLGVGSQSTETGPQMPHTGTCEESLEEPPKGAKNASFDPELVDLILSNLIGLVSKTDSPLVVAVACPDEELRCTSLQVIKHSLPDEAKVVPLTCDLNGSPGNDDVCEKKVIELLFMEGKVDVLVFDTASSLRLGQILLELIQMFAVRKILLEEKFLVLANVKDGTSWRKVLMERFRQSIIFTPAYKAEIVFAGYAEDDLTFSLFSTGDMKFYSHLSDTLGAIETKTGLTSDVRFVKDGIPNYVADFKPSIVSSDTDYFTGDAREQKLSQASLGYQDIFQFEIIAKQESIEVGEKVMVNQVFATGKWYPASVHRKTDDGNFVLSYENSSNTATVSRGMLQKTEGGASPINPGEHVLVHHPDDGSWYEGTVIDRADSSGYEVRVLKSTLEVHRSRLIRLTTEKGTGENFSCSSELVNTLVSALKPVGQVDHEVHHIGNGCIAVATWSEGDSVATWDGNTRIDINLFSQSQLKSLSTNIEMEFLSKILGLQLLSHDEQPRGCGRVVNFSPSGTTQVR